MTPLATGEFSEVFDLGDGTVLKAFFDSRPDDITDADPTALARIAFSHELRAYTELQKYPELEVYTPRFFGPVDPNQYPLQSDRTFSAGRGILLERIPGEPFKLFELPRATRRSAEKTIERMQQRFGLSDPWDASCFVPGTRADFTIIDFATPTNSIAEASRILATRGSIPDGIMRLLEG